MHSSPTHGTEETQSHKKKYYPFNSTKRALCKLPCNVPKWIKAVYTIGHIHSCFSQKVCFGAHSKRLIVFFSENTTTRRFSAIIVFYLPLHKFLEK